MLDYFLEIPIYSMSKEEYQNKINKKIEKEKNKLGLTKDNPNYDLVMKQINFLYNRPWEYNQIIGYIKFYIHDTTIHGNLWWINKNRITLNLDNKYFQYKVCYPDWNFNITKCKTSEDIYNMFCKIIPKDTTGFLKKYYVDLSYFKKYGKFLNWIKYLNIDKS